MTSGERAQGLGRVSVTDASSPSMQAEATPDKEEGDSELQWVLPDGEVNSQDSSGTTSQVDQLKTESQRELVEQLGPRIPLYSGLAADVVSPASTDNARKYYQVDVASALAVASTLNQNHTDEIKIVAQPSSESASSSPENTSLHIDQTTNIGSEGSGAVPTWTLNRGSFRDQALAWGEDDPEWTVHWLADTDPIIEVDGYELSGSLDEVLIKVVKSLAGSGAMIRLERARENHQLIIRNRGSL